MIFKFFPVLTPSFRRRCAALVSLTAMLAPATVPANASAGDGKEYLVKAAFLYNFVKFVEWPGNLSVGKIDNLNICTAGGNPFGAAEREVFAKASTPNLKLSLVELPDWQGAPDKCHILFIGGSLPTASVIAALKDKPVLTVSDSEGFAHAGGMIGFVTQAGKIKLAINNAAAQAAGLRIDAQLLEIALEVIRK